MFRVWLPRPSVAVSPLADFTPSPNNQAAEIARFFASPAAIKSLAASDFGVALKIAGGSQRPLPQVVATARFRSRSDHGTLSLEPRFGGGGVG